jgi:hypothetical protein
VSRCKDVKDEGARGECLRVGRDAMGAGFHLAARNTHCKSALGV